MEPIQSDVSEALPLEEQLKTMTKSELIKYMDDLGYQFQPDARMREDTLIKTLIENILKIVNNKKTDAQKVNEESLKMAVTKSDPEIEVRFFNLESANADLEFAYSEPKGMFGPEFIKDGKKCGNPNGHKRCPKYHLFPGEVTKMAYSVYEHVMSLTFVTHKTVWDPATGQIKGTIPIIKPRFILQPIFTKEQIVKLNT